MGHPMEVRVAVIGNVDSGKSTLVGVLTRSVLDDGRGSARSKVFKHGHEEATGRTSSIGQHTLCVSALACQLVQPYCDTYRGDLLSVCFPLISMPYHDAAWPPACAIGFRHRHWHRHADGTDRNLLIGQQLLYRSSMTCPNIGTFGPARQHAFGGALAPADAARYWSFLSISVLPHRCPLGRFALHNLKFKMQSQHLAKCNLH